jgi:hypothetical protein
MPETFIGKQIARMNRNLLIINFLLVGTIGALFYANAKYMINFFRGSDRVSTEDLARLRSVDDRFRTFVHVEGKKSISSGIRDIEQQVDKYSNKVESETTKAEYKYLMVGDRILVIKAEPGTPDATTSYSGELVPVPADVQGAVISPVQRDDPAVAGKFLPFMLDTVDYRTTGYWAVGLGVPVLLLGLWNLAKWWGRNQDVASHPVYRRLAAYGNPEMLSHEIDAAVSAGQAKFGDAFLAGSWIFQASSFALKFMKFDEVVWAYKKVTKHSVNFIPTGKTYSALVCSRTGAILTVSAGEAVVNSLLQALMQGVPWALFGYNAELQAHWTKNRAAFAAAVDERKKQSQGQSSKAATAGG